MLFPFCSNGYCSSSFTFRMFFFRPRFVNWRLVYFIIYTYKLYMFASAARVESGKRIYIYTSMYIITTMNSCMPACMLYLLQMVERPFLASWWSSYNYIINWITLMVWAHILFITINIIYTHIRYLLMAVAIPAVMLVTMLFLFRMDR